MIACCEWQPRPARAGALTERARGAAQTVCTYWLKGLCMKGDTCGFLHVFDVARMPVCRQLLKHGVCKEADCPYKHSLDDIKVAAPPLPGPALRPPMPARSRAPLCGAVPATLVVVKRSCCVTRSWRSLFVAKALGAHKFALLRAVSVEEAECARCCWREGAAAFCMLVDARVLWGSYGRCSCLGHELSP